MLCKICGGHTSKFDEGMVLGKYNVAYFLCDTCGFVFTEDPYWLDEAYSDVINKYDIGLMTRNLNMAYISKCLINGLFDGSKSFLDYGGGYGLFVRLMRDQGYDFYRYDPMCQNLFSQGYDLKETNSSSFEAVTAFEVFEHLVEPLDEINNMLKNSDSIIFSTSLVNSPPPLLTQWHYYGLEHGQHVALYSQKSMEALARQKGLNFYSNGSDVHVLTKRFLSVRKVGLLFGRNPLYRKWVNYRHRRVSLLGYDLARLKENTDDYY